MARHGYLRDARVLVGLVAVLLVLALAAELSCAMGGAVRGVVEDDARPEAATGSDGDATGDELLVVEESAAGQDAAAPQEPEPEPEPVKPAALAAGTVLSTTEIERAGGAEAFFWEEPIPDAVFARMEGKSFGADCTIPRSDLRYVKVLHVDAEGTIKVGELVVHRTVASDVVDIFRQLFEAGYPIRKMHLIDDYGASDDASCADDNTACFNFRLVTGGSTLSNHAYGLAIDISPYENPYCIPSTGFVAPAGADHYADRSLREPYMVHTDDLCYQLFISHGWSWGGDWSSPKDYQHFEKPEALWE